MISKLQKILNNSKVLKLVLVACLLCLTAWVGAESSPKTETDSEIQNQKAIIISQSEADKSSDSEKKDDTSQNKNPDAQNQKTPEKPDRAFVPSIKIDAEQAISFPYDI